MECNKIGHFCRVCQSRKSRVVNEVGQKDTQEYTEDDLEMVSINSVCFNKCCSVLTAKLKTSVDNNNMIIPYKIDTGSDGNIMLWHIFKKLSPRVTNSQLAETIKRYKLKTYNKTFITQLGTCTVTIEHKNNRKKC